MCFSPSDLRAGQAGAQNRESGLAANMRKHSVSKVHSPEEDRDEALIMIHLCTDSQDYQNTCLRQAFFALKLK